MYETKSTIQIKAPAQRVWEAVTEPAMVKQYFYNTEMKTTWDIHAPITFKGMWNGKPFTDVGTVLACEPYKFLSYNYYTSFSEQPDTPETRQIIEYHFKPISEYQTQLTIVTKNHQNQTEVEKNQKSWDAAIQSIKEFTESALLNAKQ